MQQNFHIHNMLFLLLFTNAFLVAGIGSSKQETPAPQAAIDGFMHAVIEDDEDEMRTILRTNPLVVKDRNVKGNAFILAAQYGKMKALQFMANHEYPGEITRSARANAVFYAIEGGHRDAIDFLITQEYFDVEDIQKAAKEHKKGDVISKFIVDVDNSYFSSYRPYQSGKDIFLQFVLYEAVDHDDLETVRFFLNKDRKLVNLYSNRTNVLIYAAEKGCTSIVKECLIYNPSSDTLYSAFEQAVKNGNIELMELLASKMKPEHIKYFVPHWAKELSKEQMIQILKEGIPCNSAIQDGFHINRFMQLVDNNDADEIEKTLGDEEISLDIRCKFARIALMRIVGRGDETRKTHEALTKFIAIEKKKN